MTRITKELLASAVRANGWWGDCECGRHTRAVPPEVKKRRLSHALLGRQADMHRVREGSVKTIASRLLVNVLLEGVANMGLLFPS
jgi:hypothetical protein